MFMLAGCGTHSSPVPADLVGYEIIDIHTVKDAKMATALNGKLITETGTIVNGVKQGLWITFHPNKSQPSIVANYLDGKLNGPYLTYNTAGQMTLLASCINGEFDGYYTEYENNKIRKEQYFIAGQLDGKVVDYFPRSEKKRSEMNYKNGVLEGKATYYNENGDVIQEYEYKNGEQISGGVVGEGE